MSLDQNKALVRQLIEEGFGRKNLSIVDELFAPSFVNHTAPPGFNKDREGFKKFMDMYLTAFPDLQLTVDDLIAEDDKVVARVTARGTHKGNLMTIPPTGQQVSVEVVVVWRIANGKMVERWEVIDRLGMMQQLGVIPVMAQS